MSSPKFSIITIVKNDSEGLSRTAQSVLNQSYSNFEYIVIDGESTDETLNELASLKNRAICISEPDSGISDAFNKGLAISQGNWINFLNAGDTFLDRTVLERVSKTISKYSQYSVITGFAKFGQNTIPKRIFKNYEPIHIRAMLSHQASFLSKEVFEDIGDFDLRFKLRMDYDLWLRALKKYNFYLVEDTWVEYDQNGISSHRDSIEAFFDEGKKINQKNLIENFEFVNFMLDFQCLKARFKLFLSRVFD